MGGGTKVVPLTQATQQETKIPEYLQDAGKTAIAKATDFSNTPFQSFTGESVAPMTQNQTAASTMARNSTGAGTAFMDQARLMLGQGQGARGAAGGSAVNNAGAGQAGGNTAAALARLAGATANDNVGAGQGDLAGARRSLGRAEGYNAESASPVTADQIRGYFNPYIQTALDPVIANLNRSAGQTDAGIRAKAGMSGAFGGSRMGLQQTENSGNLLRQIATTSGDAYSTGYDKALAAAQLDKSRQGQAAQTSISAGQARNQVGSTADTLANNSVSRLTQSAGANTAAGLGQSQLADSDLQRFISLINPSLALSGENRAMASSDSALTNDAINRLMTTGQTEQTYNQNVDNAAYQQYLNQQNDALVKLNALISAAGGTPYSTSSNSTTQGQQIVQTPSMLGQLAGAAGAAASIAAMSDRDMKEDFSTVDDEDVLARFRGVPVEEYRYKEEARPIIGDDGRKRIGPMAQDWAKQFGGDGHTIPMPEIIGGLVSAVRALDRRTAATANDRTKETSGSALRRLAA